MRTAFKIGAGFDILVGGAFIVLVCAMAVGYIVGTEQSDEQAAVKLAQEKEACSYEVLQAIRVGKTPDGVTAALNSSPHAQKACAKFQINDVPLIQK